MEMKRRHYLAIFGTFFSFCFRLQECIKQEGYEFPVYSTDFCPRNETEWKERSKVLNCTEKNGYTCLPNEHFTELLEFCYTDPWILIEEGVCLYLIKKNSLVNGYSCHNFQFGCPKFSYISTEIYEHPSCTLVDSGCFQADQICKSSTKNVLKENEKNYWILVATPLGVFFILCVMIMLTIYYRKKIPYCKRNIDGENHVQEENLQFIQRNKKESKEEIIAKNTLKATLVDRPLKVARIKEISRTEVQQSPKSTPYYENVQEIQISSNGLAVAAFDFGPTDSGSAFSWRSKWREVVVVNLQQNGLIMKNKAPTTLLLNPDQSFCAFGYEAENIFSDMEEKDSESDDEAVNFSKENCSNYYYFQKLSKFLHEDKLHRDSIIKDFSGKTMKAMKIFSIFIEYLKDSFLETMNKFLGHIEVSESDIDFVLVVPALCGEGAKMFMREAAIKAGISENQLTLAFEEEVVVFYCQHMHLERHHLFPMQQNECVVVDIGGVRVDVAVHYKQDKNATFKKIVLANGGQCGEMSVNDEFEKFMETIGGKGVMELFAKDDMDNYLNMLRSFETKKYDRLGSGSIVRINVPPTLDELIKQKCSGGIPEVLQSTIYRDSVTYKRNVLCIPYFIYKTFFQKAISKITNFMEEILTKTDTKNIIIIGRFAGCEIIQQSILENFKTYRVVIPPDPEFAVLKGAVYFGHIRNTTSIRVSRYSFGVGIKQQFSSRENKDDEQIDTEALPQGKTDIIHLVGRGEEIKLGFEYNVFQLLKTNLGDVKCELYVSDQKDLVYTYKKDCKLLGKLLVQLPSETNEVEIREGIVFSDTEIIFRVTLDCGRIFEKSFDIFDERFFPNF